MSFRKVKKVLGPSFVRRGMVLTIYPTPEQERYLIRVVQLYRFVYNWALDTREAYYKEHGVRIDDKILQRMLSDMRNSEEYNWLKDTPLATLRNAINDCDDAYRFWFNKNCRHKRPKYKTKKHSKESFATRPERFYIEDNMIKIEGLKDRILIKWHSGLTKADEKVLKYANVRIFKDPIGKWKVSFTIIIPKIESKYYDPYTEVYTPKYNRAIGIDLNKKNLIVTSYMDGEIYRLPKEVEKYWSKYLEENKLVQRDIKLTKRRYPEISNLEDYDLSDYKSNNAKKRQIKRNKLRRKVHNIIITYAHTIAKKIISRYPKAIVMENLPILNWYKLHNQAKGISYIPFHNIRIIFQYKCENYGVPFILADKTYPSTQQCSCCGHIQKMIGKHTYKCPVCGMIKDRDINAAFNLEQLAYNDCIDALEWIA